MISMRKIFHLLLLLACAALFLVAYAACGDDGDGYGSFYGGNGYGEWVCPVRPEDTTNTNAFFYFSYDDSASTVAVELAKYKLAHNQLPDSSLARPWEFLNYESFQPGDTNAMGFLQVAMGLRERNSSEYPAGKEYKLGVYVASAWIDKAARDNLVITLVVDVSGSMDVSTLQVEDTSVTRMDLVRYGLNRMVNNSLKDGDVVNLVVFNHEAHTKFQGLTYPADKQQMLDTIAALTPDGSTDLNKGVSHGYQVAHSSYDAAKKNRLVLLTDAFANTGEIDPQVISGHTSINEQEGILFSGLGISADFNEAFLNELAEAGKGSYFSLITRSDARRVFEERFIALVMVAARHVRFRLDYPAQLEHQVTASEESSTNPEDVLPTNFSYNTSQYFFEGFVCTNGQAAGSDVFKLTVYYRDPVDGSEKQASVTRTVSQLLGKQTDNIRDAEAVYLFNQLLARRVTYASVTNMFATHYPGESSTLFDEYCSMIDKLHGLQGN